MIHLNKSALLLFVLVAGTGPSLAIFAVAKATDVELCVGMGISQDRFESSLVLVTSESTQACSTGRLHPTQRGRHIVTCTQKRICSVAMMVSIHFSLKFTKLGTFMHHTLGHNCSAVAANDISILSVQNEGGLIIVATALAFLELRVGNEDFRQKVLLWCLRTLHN